MRKRQYKPGWCSHSMARAEGSVTITSTGAVQHTASGPVELKPRAQP